MLRFQSFQALWSAVLVALAVTAAAYSQNLPAKQTAQQDKTKQEAGPVTMTECEGVNNCATWTFLGTQGNGQWPSGEIANLNVESFDNDSVVIRRADSTGAAAGLTALYKGTRHGDRIGGEFTSSWPGHWNSMSGNWYATIGKAATPPPVMRICDPNGSCGTWTWNNGHYDGVWNAAGVSATMRVASFTAQSVIVKRTDLGGRAGFAYTYSGKISADGNSILNGQWVGDPDSRQAGATGHFTATWGTALDDNPAARNAASNPQVRVVVPVVCYPWFFGVVCQ